MFFSLAWKKSFFSKINGMCPAVVSDDDSQDHACTHTYLLAPGETIKTWNLVGDGFFYLIQSFETNEKFFFKQTNHRTSKSCKKKWTSFSFPLGKNISFLLSIL